MGAIIKPTPEPDDPALPFLARLAWLGGLALSAALGVVGVAYLLKAVLQ